ncbi:MAG: MTH938/NDUFAF3 family protein [Ancalomicrobiaceae bacterium]|nr:MTH938/NDUFAF3 family protein [Ancalomicrobiaceae bacterium]
MSQAGGGGRRPHLPEQVVIEAYGGGGFRFAGMSHRGSLLALPSGLYAWDVANPERLGEADFAELLLETARIDVLLIGTGGEMRPLPEALRWQFRDRRIQADAMQTGHAVRTYNILIAENRRVAGAFVAVE